MKNETPTLLKKLKTYSAMAGSIVAVAGTANAQVIYTDIDPDSTVQESDFVYSIDLNNDGTNDFGIGYHKHTFEENGIYYSNKRIFAKPYNGGSIAGYQNEGNYPYAIGAGEMIDANLEWQEAASQTMVDALAYLGSTSLIKATGQFYGGTDKYIGLRFKLGTETHYGWARFDIPELIDSFTIKDYAYNLNPNDGLFAGQGDPTDVQVTPMTETVKIFSYEGIVNALLINQKIDHATLVITNTMGQQVKITSLTQATTRLDVSDLPFGIYMVTVTNGGQTFTQKVALRK